MTWQWLAPEVIDAESLKSDERADIYSFGIVAWEILTRAYPFDEFEVLSHFQTHTSHTRPPPFTPFTLFAPFNSLTSQNYCTKLPGADGRDVVVFREQNIKKAIVTESLRPTVPPALLPCSE